MSFWDTSAIVPLIVREQETPSMLALLKTHQMVTVWTLAEIEIVSALARRKREGSLTEDGAQQAEELLAQFWNSVTEVVDVTRVKLRATRLLKSHTLRAADAMQLAAALLATRDQPEGQWFVTLDQRLAEAAKREAFSVGPQGQPEVEAQWRMQE